LENADNWATDEHCLTDAVCIQQ